MRKYPDPSRGFSLLELLTVMVVISIMAGLSIMSLRGTSGSINVAAAGGELADLLETARGAAILKNTPVAVILLMSGEKVNSRVFTMLQYQSQTGTWTQASKWEFLPLGVLMDTANATSLNFLVPGNSPPLSPALPTVSYQGASYAPGTSLGYGYIVFLPDGSLYQTHSQPCVLKLVEGVSTASGLSFTGTKDGSGNPINFFEIVINETTGRVKIVRP